ncbi:MAG: heavy metal-binding domain-containing protein [Planctomycetota bacterium]
MSDRQLDMHDDKLPTDLSLSWWLQFLHVRLRFVTIVLISAVIMVQWDRLQSLIGVLFSRVTGRHPASEIAADHEYFCPMDPGVLSAWPAICSICNMDLVPRKKGDAELLPEGVVARMQISPYRIQLSGLRTTAVVPCQSRAAFSLHGVLTLPSASSAASDKPELLVPVSRQDAAVFTAPTPVTVTSERFAGTLTATAQCAVDQVVHLPLVRVEISGFPDGIPPGPVPVTVQVQVPLAGALTSEQRAVLGERTLLQIPASAVVDYGGATLVYVQTMPGMFDGRLVQLGPRSGPVHAVLTGLEAGEQVVSAGAFLVDAEARLNPALAVGYFGADQPAATSTSALAPLKTAAKATPFVLSDSDRVAADAQGKCPVTGLPLDSMGGPVPVQLGDRRVFICCAACERRLRKEPGKYLEAPSSDDRDSVAP